MPVGEASQLAASRETLAGRYIGLYLFPEVPKMAELEEHLQAYNNYSNPGVIGCALYREFAREDRAASALLIVDAGHHPEALPALTATWRPITGALLGVEVVSSEGPVLIPFHKPKAPVTVEIVAWPLVRTGLANRTRDRSYD